MIAPFVEVIVDGRITEPTLKLSGLGRDPEGRPINGRCEPEGLSALGALLLVGFATGSRGHATYQHRIYCYPLG